MKRRMRFHHAFAAQALFEVSLLHIKKSAKTFVFSR